jgi:arsenite-transporting ATPase
VVKALRPVLSRAAGVPMPADSVFDAVQRLHDDLGGAADPAGPDATVRLVLTPETVVVAEARRSLTTLSLYGYRVDGVIANRCSREATATPGGPAGWRRSASVLAEVTESFPRVPVWRSSYQPGEPVGPDALAAFAAAAYGGDDPLAGPDGGGPLTITRTDTGPVLRIDLPFATAGGRRPGPARRRARGHGRVLPAAVRAPGGARPARGGGARVEDGSLRVRFQIVREATHG